MNIFKAIFFVLGDLPVRRCRYPERIDTLLVISHYATGSLGHGCFPFRDTLARGFPVHISPENRGLQATETAKDQMFTWGVLRVQKQSILALLDPAPTLKVANMHRWVTKE